MLAISHCFCILMYHKKLHTENHTALKRISIVLNKTFLFSITSQYYKCMLFAIDKYFYKDQTFVPSNRHNFSSE